jgi:hypothetical protein
MAALYPMRRPRSYTTPGDTIQSPEMIEARQFLSSQDLTDPLTLQAVTTPQLDRRISAVAVHYQQVARLLNRGVLDEELFGAYHDMTPRIWKALAPVAAVMRERSNTPRWIDIEYLAYRAGKKRLLHKFLRRYKDEFVEQAKLATFISAVGDMAK